MDFQHAYISTANGNIVENTQYLFDESQPDGPAAPAHLAILSDSKNRLWSGHWAGALSLLQDDGTFKHFRSIENDKKSTLAFYNRYHVIYSKLPDERAQIDV